MSHPPRSQWSRRRLLASGAGLVAAAPIAGTPAPAMASNSRAGGAGVTPRVSLVPPGPMLPPVPAAVISVHGAPGDPAELSVLWSFVINGDPPQVGVSAGDEHVAGPLIERHGQFVINVLGQQWIDPFDRIDMSSSRVADKFALSGFSQTAASQIDAPAIGEALIQLECRVSDRVEVPPERTVFFAEVVATTVLDGVCDPDGRLQVDSAPFFGMTAGSGEFYTMGHRIGHIGMTAGRDDIRY